MSPNNTCISIFRYSKTQLKVGTGSTGLGHSYLYPIPLYCFTLMSQYLLAMSGYCLWAKKTLIYLSHSPNILAREVIVDVFDCK